MAKLPLRQHADTTARINGRAIAVRQGETLLQAALREGVDFPNSCRVGGCGACRCRLTSGEVTEFTETGYLLSADDLNQNTILACQSAPRGPVTIEVDLPDATPVAAPKAAPEPLPVAAPVAARAVAGVWDYTKYGLFHVLGLLAVISLLSGGAGITFGLVTIVTAYVLGDAFGGDDTTTPRHAYPQVLTGLLWGALPLMALIAFVSVWTVCDTDPLGFGAAVTALTGYDVLTARAATGTGHHLSGLILTILANGLVSLIAGHELVHRTWDRTSLRIGRLLYAFAFDANFSIEHVYGHHRYAATLQDPATAPRGRSVYAHVLISTLRGNVSSWRIEKARLQSRRLPVLSRHNVFLRGHLLNLGMVGIAWAMGGAVAAGYFLAIALGGKSILEMVNYMEHYGMVRDPSDPVAPHHSWNTNRRVSSWAMFNLTRHSHHHAEGEVPFSDLRPFPDAPMMVNGYLTTMFLTMIPPLWHHFMTPKVLEWDAVHASPTERRMAAEANARSGIPQLWPTAARETPPFAPADTPGRSSDTSDGATRPWAAGSRS